MISSMAGLLYSKNGTVMLTRKNFGSLWTNLSKAFECVLNDLVIAKMQAFGIHTKALRLIKAYLLNCILKTKVGQEHSFRK